jgi:hypothetical protein
MLKNLRELLAKGITVIEIPREVLDQFNLENFLNGQREYKVSNPDTIFVLGAFGALGNPSSQHHPEARKLRVAMYKHMIPLFKEIYENKYIEMIPDRFSIRNKSLPVTSESWHRDCSALIGESDDIYGGYLNLDERQTQYFSCIPGTHMDTETEDCEGFAKLPSEKAKEYDSRREIIRVPPGCAILFNEKIIHEIAKREIEEQKSYRQYFKWRISSRPVSTFGWKAVLKTVNTQASFPLHNVGDTPFPPMYGKVHIMYWGEKIEEFSKNLKEEFLDRPNKRGRVYVKRVMPSLQEAGIELFPEYTDEECNMLFPQPL